MSKSKSLTGLLMTLFVLLASLLLLGTNAKAIDITYTNNSSIIAYYNAPSQSSAGAMTATVNITGINGSVLNGTIVSVSEDAAITVSSGDTSQTAKDSSQDFTITGVNNGSIQLTIAVDSVSALEPVNALNPEIAQRNRVAFKVGDDWYNIFLSQGMAPNQDAYNLTELNIDPLEETQGTIYPVNLNSVGNTNAPTSVIYAPSATLAANQEVLGALTQNNNQATFTLSPELSGFTTNTTANANCIFATAELANSNVGCYQIPVCVEPIIKGLAFKEGSSYTVGGSFAGPGSVVSMAQAAQPGPLSIMGNSEGASSNLTVTYTNCVDSSTAPIANLSNVYGSLSSISSSDNTLISQTRVHELQNTISFSSSNPAVAVAQNTLSEMANLRIGSVPGTATVTAFAQQGQDFVATSGDSPALTIQIPASVIRVSAMEAVAGTLDFYNMPGQSQYRIVGLNLIPSSTMVLDNFKSITMTLSSNSDQSIQSTVTLTPDLISEGKSVSFTGTELGFFEGSFDPTDLNLLLIYSGGASNINNAGDYTLSVTVQTATGMVSAQTSVNVINESATPQARITYNNNPNVYDISLGASAPTAQLGTQLSGFPDDATLFWKTNNPNVATVNENGLLTAQGEGQALISLYVNGLSCENPIEVTVVSLSSRVTGIAPARSEVNLAAGSAYQIISNIRSTPENTSLLSTDPLDYEYQCSNPAYAIRNGMLLVPADASGSETITVTYGVNNIALTTSFIINVTQQSVSATGVTAQSELTFGMNDPTPQNVAAQLTPENSTAQPLNVTYTSSNTNVAVVDANGNVTPIGQGQATISTIYTTQCPFNQFTASTSVSVVENATPKPEEPLTVSPATVTLTMDSGGPNSATVTANVPATLEGELVWTTSNSSVATVTGIEATSADINAVGPGAATITVTCGDQSASVAVTVTESEGEPSGPITVSPVTAVLSTLEGGINTVTATATVPEGFTGSLEWTTSANSVATVESTGPTTALITAVSPGSATIRISDSSGQGASVYVTVSDNPIIAEGTMVLGEDPDYFSVTLQNVRANESYPGTPEEDISNVSIFTWSGPQQNDMDAKEAVRVPGTNDWTYENFPVNDTAVNNYYFNADSIFINAYASTSADSSGYMIGSYVYNWMAPVYETSVGYIAYSQDYGFVKPTVFDGAVAGTVGESKHLEGLRVSSTLDGVEINASVHAADIGWMEAVPDGTYAGTMGENRQLEAVRFTLSGPNADKYYLVYSVHAADIGWMDPVSTETGNPDEIYAGTVGQNRQIEAFTVEIRERQ